jgi:hypothetical protein
MTYTYKYLKSSLTGQQLKIILRKEDNACIPMVEANTDYQAYLLWVSEGGVTEAAD